MSKPRKTVPYVYRSMITVLVEPDQQALWKAAAKRDGFVRRNGSALLGTWIKAVCDEKAGKS
jgi:hypothetical protein